MEGNVIYHEEQRFSWWVFVIIAVIAIPVVLITYAAIARGGAAIAPSLLGPIVLGAVLIMFISAKLVVDVDDRAIHVGFHYLWPTRHIPLQDVRSAKATKYNSMIDYGGWGVRLSPKGWAFNTGGNEGVLVEPVTGKKVMIGSHRPRELEEAIARAVEARASR